MKCYEVDRNIKNLISETLTNQTMEVVVNGESSEPASVDSGVPQGTVQGPILYMCHINDLPDHVMSTVRLFADDCLLYRCIRSARDHTLPQNNLHKLEKWATKWGMQFNTQTNAML